MRVIASLSPLAFLVVLSSCSSASGQTEPPESSAVRAVFTGTSDADGNASLTLPSSVGTSSSLPVIAVYVQDGNTNRWSNVSDGDGDQDGNGSWLVDAPPSGPLVVRMRELDSRNSLPGGPVNYRVVVIY